VYFRVVRFTGVTPERITRVVTGVKDADGPPEGIPATGVQFLYDESQQTAVVLQQFDTAQDMDKGDRAFAAMDPSEAPGTRVSVDMCELKLGLAGAGFPARD